MVSLAESTYCPRLRNQSEPSERFPAGSQTSARREQFAGNTHQPDRLRGAGFSFDRPALPDFRSCPNVVEDVSSITWTVGHAIMDDPKWLHDFDFHFSLLLRGGRDLDHADAAAGRGTDELVRASRPAAAGLVGAPEISAGVEWCPSTGCT